MKRFLLSVLAVVLLLVLGLGGLFASAFIGNAPIQPGLVDGFIHVVPDSYVTANILDCGDGKVMLIDAGDDKAGKAIIAELAAMHLDAHAVAAIFLTHGHGDHVGAVPLFPDAKTYALQADVALAEGRTGGQGPLARVMPVKPTGVRVTRGLVDGEVVQVGNRALHVFAIPGHTAGSAAFWVDGALFLGDSAGASNDGKVRPAPKVFSDNTDENRASIKALPARLAAAHLDVKTLIFAHTGRLQGLKPLVDFAAQY